MTAKQDQAQRVKDLETALLAIGRILADPALPPMRRIEQVRGIVRMYVELPSEGKPA